MNVRALVCAAVAALPLSSCVTAAAPVKAASSSEAPTKPPTKKKPSRELSSEATRATLQAELLLQESDVAGAVAELKAAVGHDAKSPYLRLRLGEALLMLGDADGADDAANAAVDLATSIEEKTAALRLKAQARDVLGDDDGSVAALKKALELHPDRMASAMLADRLVKRGDLDGAEAAVGRWMAAEPGAVDGWVSLARVFAERGLVDRAFLHLQKALDENADDDDALHLRRDLLLALGRFDEAAEASRTLANARGDSVDVRAALLQSLALQNADEARALAKGWLDDDGGDQNRMMVADAFERTGLVDDALQTLAAAPQSRALLSLERARLLLHLRRPDDAAGLACEVGGGLEPRLLDYGLSLCVRAEADAGHADDAVARVLEAAGQRPSARLIESMRSLAKKASLSRRAALRQTLEGFAKGDLDDDVAVAASFVFDDLGEHDAALALMTKTLAKKSADGDLVFAHARLVEAQAAAGKDGDAAALGAVELVERLVERNGADASTLNFSPSPSPSESCVRSRRRPGPFARSCLIR